MLLLTCFFIYIYAQSVEDKGVERNNDRDRDREKEKEKERIENAIQSSATTMSFRISFNPNWFLNVLEKCQVKDFSTPNITRKNTSTFTLTVRFLAVMMQSDALLRNEFCTRDGIKSLRSLILPQVELSDVILLLGMFFRIPIHLLPLPCQLDSNNNNSKNGFRDENKKREKTVFSTTEKNSRKPCNFTTLLNDCPGPDVSEGGLKDFSIPLLEILLECVMTSPCADASTYETKSDIVLQQQQQQQQQKGENRGREIILSAFSQAYITLPSFRRLLQQRAVLQAVITTMAYFTNAGTVTLQDIIPPSQPCQDLPGTLREDHFSVTQHAFASPIPNRARNLFHREIVREGRGETGRDVGSDKDRERERDREESSSRVEKKSSQRNIGRIGSALESTGSSAEAQAGLFQASANWESLFSAPSPSNTPTQTPTHPSTQTPTNPSTPTPTQSQSQPQAQSQSQSLSRQQSAKLGSAHTTPSGSDRRVRSYDDLNQFLDDKNTGQNMQCKTDVTDEGEILLNLLSSTITSAITEYSNPTMLSTLLLSLPTVGYCEESLQSLIIQTFKNVISEIFTSFSDINPLRRPRTVMSVLSGILNCLIPLLKAGILFPRSCFGIFEITITVLVKSYEMFSCDTGKIGVKERGNNFNSDFIDDVNSDNADREKEKERRESHKIAALLNVKDLGKTARYFASFSLNSMESQDLNPSAESSSRSTYTC